MTAPRTQSTKLVIVSYPGDADWEVWRLRFNRGSKLNRPVKFFASREWKFGTTGAPHAGTHWDFPNEGEAETWFAADLAEYGGVVHRATPENLARVKALGYVAI